MKLRTEGGRVIMVRPFRTIYLCVLVAILWHMAGGTAACVGFLMALDVTLQRP